MASGTISTRPQAESAPTQGRYEDFIQKRLEHTRRQVRLVDVASSLMLLAAASLVFFLAVAVLDHWVFHHGLSFIARLGLFALWVAGAGAFAWRFLLPPLANRINPVFAAQTIEQGRPTLKNSLINFLLLRSHPQDVAPVVFRAMEHRAAADLLKVPVDHAVDRGRIVHLACVLAAVVAIFALYLALSPKNPLVSAARVLWPWSSVPAPTRVHIEEVSPGDKIVFNDDREPISAQVTGLRDGEEVALLVSTADGQVVDDRIVMTRGRRRQPLSLRIAAGQRRFSARHVLSHHRRRCHDAAVQAGSPDRAHDHRRPHRLPLPAVHRAGRSHDQEPGRYQGPGRHPGDDPCHGQHGYQRGPDRLELRRACKRCP